MNTINIMHKQLPTIEDAKLLLNRSFHAVNNETVTLIQSMFDDVIRDLEQDQVSKFNLIFSTI